MTVPLNVVLVEPEIPQNTGNISRTCAVTGARLHLVGPMGFSLGDRQLKRAGLDYWGLLDVTYYENYAAFEAQVAAGACYYFTAKGKILYTDIAYPSGAYLIFGKETAGLPRALLDAHPGRCVRLPMRTLSAEAAAAAPGLWPRCLNLSNAVAVGVFEAWRQQGFAGGG